MTETFICHKQNTNNGYNLGISPSKKFVCEWCPAVKPNTRKTKLSAQMMANHNATVQCNGSPPNVHMKIGRKKGIAFDQLNFFPSRPVIAPVIL